MMQFMKDLWQNPGKKLQSEVKKNTGALFINQYAADLTAIFYHAVLVYVPELYAWCAPLSLD